MIINIVPCFVRVYGGVETKFRKKRRCKKKTNKTFVASNRNFKTNLSII